MRLYFSFAAPSAPLAGLAFFLRESRMAEPVVIFDLPVAMCRDFFILLFDIVGRAGMAFVSPDTAAAPCSVGAGVDAFTPGPLVFFGDGEL